jgi:predicted Zn-dependent protease
MTRFNSSLNYRLMKAKLTVISAASAKQVVQYYRAKTEKNSLAIHPEYYYGYGLALFKKQSYSQAIKVLRALKASEPQSIVYSNALAKAYIASEEKAAVNAGLKLLSTTSKNNPYNLVVTANYAYALMQTGQLTESISLLENYNKNNFKHPAIYKLLSRALGKDKQLVRAHIAEANYYYLNGVLDAAIEQLDIARKITPKNDFYTLSKLNARKRAFQEEKNLYKLDEE